MTAGQVAIEREPSPELPPVKSRLITLFHPIGERWAVGVVDKRDLIREPGPLFFAWTGQYSTHVFKVGDALRAQWTSDLGAS